MESTNTISKTILGAGLGVLLVFTFVGQAVAQGGTWETKAPLPFFPTRDPSTTVAGGIAGKLYAAGFKRFPFAPVLVVYDPKTDTWDTTKAPPPTLRGAKGGVIDGNLFVVGGCINFDCVPGINNVLEMYDAATDTWTIRASMPTARAFVAAAVIAGKLHVVGGNVSCGAACTPLTTHEVFDPSAGPSGGWSTLAPMPAARNTPAAAAVSYCQKLVTVGSGGAFG